MSRRRIIDSLLLLALFYAALVGLHASVLRLPYFWDEAGYYVPAARDIFLTGSLIPTSTLSNAHPPLLLAYLAGMWKVFGYSPLVTRLAMLLVSAFCLLGVFRLARRVLNAEVAIGSVVALALYPVYFAQSSLAQMDLGATAFLIWGLDFYLRDRGCPTSTRGRQMWASIIFFSAAALTKETAILVPVALFVWESLQRIPRFATFGNRQSAIGNSFLLLLSAVPLAVWFAYHYSRTGHIFGNPEFYSYNVAGTLSIPRFFAALVLRIWHLFGYMNMALMTAAVLLAMTMPALAADSKIRTQKSETGNDFRPRIALDIQAIFYVLILVHLVAFSLVGGAALARYLLPVYPLVIIVGVSTLRRRLPWWPAFLAVVCVGFVIALITEPPYRFAPEDNLAYSDYVRLHESAERLIAARFPHETVLTAWPASDELTRPWLGYVPRSVRILRIEDFSFEQLQSAAQVRGQFQLAFVFSTKEEPRLLFNFRWWEKLQERYFGYHRDLLPVDAAQVLGGHLVYQQHRGSQWVGIIALDVLENASAQATKALIPRQNR